MQLIRLAKKEIIHQKATASLEASEEEEKQEQEQGSA